MNGNFLKKVVIYYITFLAYIKLKFFFKGTLISLGGCFGKSSAIKLIEGIIATEHNIYSSDKDGKGMNSESGIPFVILGISPSQYRFSDWLRYVSTSTVNLFKKDNHNVLLLEYGVDSPGDMKHLVTFFKPNIGILLNSNNTHSANFEKLKESTGLSFEKLIARENGFIFERAKDAIFYNIDDPEVVAQISRFKGNQSIPYSTVGDTAIRKFKSTIDGTKVVFNYLGQERSINYPGPLLEEYRSTFELGIKIAEYFKIKGENLEKALLGYKLPAGRCTLFDGINETKILDSSYNSSFVPTSSALELMKSLSAKRKVAILGDMRELGILSQKEHEKLALVAVEKADCVITVGPMMMEYFFPIFEANKRPDQSIISFKTTKEALDYISKNDFEFLQPEDMILVKASQNTLLLEIIVEKLLKNKSDAAKLCRRDELYEIKRAELLV